VAASSKLMLPGLAVTIGSGTRTKEAKENGAKASTASPGAKRLTSSPTALTTPEHSMPTGTVPSGRPG